MKDLITGPFLFALPALIAFLWFLRYVAEALLRADSMLERLHGYYRRDWVAAGAPKGWGWSPPGTISFAGIDLLRHSGGWAAKRPVWADLDPQIRRDFDRWLHCYRKAHGWPFFVFALLMVGASVYAILAVLGHT